MKEVYFLKADVDGTMFSHDTDLGVAVTSLEEAEKFVNDGGVGYTHSYSKITIFDDKDEAVRFALNTK